MTKKLLFAAALCTLTLNPAVAAEKMERQDKYAAKVASAKLKASSN